MLIPNLIPSSSFCNYCPCLPVSLSTYYSITFKCSELIHHTVYLQHHKTHQQGYIIITEMYAYTSQYRVYGVGAHSTPGNSSPIIVIIVHANFLYPGAFFNEQTMTTQ